MRRLERQLRPARAGREMVGHLRPTGNVKGDTGRRLAREIQALGQAEASEAFSK
jgi:hypothetical protein